MRWESQRVDQQRQQTLPGLPGLVRSVETPEFAGMVFHEVHARSVLNKVPGQSPMPFRWTINPYRGCGHACRYCLAGDTPILLADGRTRPLADLSVGDEIYGTERQGSRRRYVTTRVLAHWSTVKPAYRLTLRDGTRLIASGDHRFLTDRGWRHVAASAERRRRAVLATGDKLVGTGGFASAPKGRVEYRCGYLAGIAAAFAEPTDQRVLGRAREYLTGPESISLPVERPLVPSEEWHKGYLAGVFDVDGEFARGHLQVARTNRANVSGICDALLRLDFRFALEDLGHRSGVQRIRLSGGLAEHLRFLHTVDPARTGQGELSGVAVRGAERLGVETVEPLGLELPLFDITTGTGDFIANGVVSHNCFARNSHTYLDLDSGEDFDNQVVVKVNAVEVLTAQLRSPRWTREHVAMGTNTDPYQRAEGRYRLMPGIIRALADSGTPFNILTKGTVLSRDLPLLREVSADVPVGLGVSIALIDRELQRSLEPGTASPQARLELVRKIVDAGLPCGVFVAPVLPGLTDSIDQLDALLAAIADTGATGVTVLPLHLRPGAREWFAAWLVREHPELVPSYRQIYARGANADVRYRRWLGRRVGPLLRRYDLAPKEARPARAEDPTWPEGSLASIPEQAAPVRQEQLELL
ncbi:intein-containing Rv2578c family radical SAM protein [Actinophytocola gossypii]|uniref:Intein-containing Rv2578c family radical SAM protein n=1 Tax=Actinophytocola gossypii TaxID=2812003 RepID=A0ABT2J697_9PSEU|nr:intein-containing Rv2578c family radical SAM protein [Actinophytocola gossypii]MCT2583211.1 intein-containing Rv2578c family radical SAM protein [Actinophytocola gossypii]